MTKLMTSPAAVKARMSALLSYQTKNTKAVLNELTGMLAISKDTMAARNKKPHPGSIMQILDMKV
jgi:hypothetical protein